MGDEQPGRTEVALILGYRFAGKSLVLQHLERAGYTCVDNLPVGLVGDYLDHQEPRGARQEPLGASQELQGAQPEPKAGVAGRKFAVVVDAARAGEAGDGRAVLELRDGLAAAGYRCGIVFLEASESALSERMGGSRPHALAEADRAARDLERRWLAPAREAADLVLDSSYSSPADEAKRIIALGGDEPARSAPSSRSAPSATSMAPPRATSSSMWALFIPNPYYVAGLRPLSGKDKACADYVLGSESARGALEGLVRLVASMEAGYALQHRPLLRVCVGCTGGWHRSVAMVEALGSALAGLGLQTATVHREFSKAGRGPTKEGEAAAGGN